MRPLPDRYHQLVHRWQPPWLRAWGLRHPGPYQALSGLLLVPLFVACLWVPAPAIAPQAVVFMVFFVVSYLYEDLMTGPNFSDVVWRQVGALVVWVTWWLIPWALT